MKSVMKTIGMEMSQHFFLYSVEVVGERRKDNGVTSRRVFLRRFIMCRDRKYQKKKSTIPFEEDETVEVSR